MIHSLANNRFMPIIFFSQSISILLNTVLNVIRFADGMNKYTSVPSFVEHLRDSEEVKYNLSILRMMECQLVESSNKLEKREANIWKKSKELTPYLI